MKNRLVELVICMLVIGSCFMVVPQTVRGAWDPEGYIYIVDYGTSKATITGYNGSGGSISIPSTLGGYTTVGISNNAFNNSYGDSIISVTIPDTVVYIGGAAFRSCSNLTSVTIGDGVTNIGAFAFADCSNLTSLLIGTSVININNSAFSDCSYLTSVTIPNSVDSIKQNAFTNCASLVNVTIIGSGVTTIGKEAFANCVSLINLSIGIGVTNIGSSAFSNCIKLISVNIPNSVTTLGNYTFYNCISLVDATIGSGIANIMNFTFYYCDNLTSVNIENVGTMKFGTLMFGYCPQLESINFLGLVSPTTSPVTNWISNTHPNIRGHAYEASDFPPDGSFWMPGPAQLLMGSYIPASNTPMFGTPSPLNNSLGNPLSLIWSIPINDTQGDTFNWTIHCSNGQTNSGNGDTNGTKSLSLSGLAYSTAYTIWVNATDPTGSNLYTRRWYRFTTKANTPPEVGTPSPTNGSTGNLLSLSWGIPINDLDGDTFSWTIQCSNGQVNSGTAASGGTKSLSLSGLAYSTAYTIWVNATDPIGSNLYTRRWYNFTTKTNTPPVFSTPSPNNGSTGNPRTLSWSIPITDEEKFNWTIQCSNGQNISKNNESTGTKTIALTGLTYLTTYTVWVNATDPTPTGSGEWTNKSYTFTPTNTPPIYGTSSPTNGSTGQPLTLSWSIPITDEEKFNWTIQCSNGQNISKNNESTGTKSLTLSGLAYSTVYTIWVNATDPIPAGSGLYNHGWFRFTTKASGGGGDGGTEPVENKRPVADLSAGEPYQGLVNTKITFDGSKSNDSDGDITKWIWVFGDNITGSGETIQHTYSKAGTYTVSLTVTDNDGATHSDTTTCIISKPTNRAPSIPTITGPTSGTKNTMYTYTAVSTDADNDTVKYTITWGDPASQFQSSDFLPSGSVFMVDLIWATAGRYDITVTATDNTTTSSSKTTVYIDAEQAGDIGYLLDNNGDGIYDAFYSDALKQITNAEQKDGNYNIDYDGDGDWDYTFDALEGLTSYQPPKTNGVDLVLVIGVIVAIVVLAGIVAFVWKRKRSV